MGALEAQQLQQGLQNALLYGQHNSGFGGYPAQGYGQVIYPQPGTLSSFGGAPPTPRPRTNLEWLDDELNRVRIPLAT